MSLVWYVHHQGHGHRSRALAIARHLEEPVVALSSLPAPDGWPGEWIELPADDDGPIDRPDAGGVLHWAPLNHRGHRHRMLRIADALADARAAVVDTSVEVTLLARLLGVPTAVIALRGDRTDPPHLAAFGAATRIVAPWTRRATERWWPAEWLTRTTFTGAISRFDGLDRVRPRRERRVVLVSGNGGTSITGADVAAARAVTPGWDWLVRTPDKPSADLWADLCTASVVVTLAGDSTVAEVAAARAPAVVIADERPFGEQHATVNALARLGCAVALHAWPDAAAWPGLLERAACQDPRAWDAWTHGDGARRAAHVLHTLAREAR